MPEWFIYAALSAVFAALTAIFAKLGVKDIDSDFATFIRTIVVVFMLILLLSVAKKWQPLSSLSPKNWLFLILSGMATGLSWLMYFKAMQAGKVYQVALVDKFSVVLAIILAVIFLGERLNLKEIFKNNVSLNIGTDGLSSNISLNFWHELRAALFTHASLDLNELATRLFVAATHGGAKALRTNNGEIKAGRAADLAVYNDLECDDSELILQLILHTNEAKKLYIGGKICKF